MALAPGRLSYPAAAVRVTRTAPTMRSKFARMLLLERLIHSRNAGKRKGGPPEPAADSKQPSEQGRFRGPREALREIGERSIFIVG